uniref:V-set domain containing T cell activation inhibitor 1 n=1 Tax=Sphenodon punctatus TaxID=8508 RepID=A0A8D0HHQ0_SPHPU
EIISCVSVSCSMVTIIVILTAVTGLIIGFGVSGKHAIYVTTLTSAGSIGETSVLGCTFEPDIRLSKIEILWAKDGVSGVVHRFQGGKDHLTDQAKMFQGRTAVFSEQVIGGNASLMLRDVQVSDAGTYRCSVTTSKGNGEAVLEYKTGAFSSPQVHVDYNSSREALRCEAPRWYPQPVVTWMSPNDTEISFSQATDTTFMLDSKNVTMKVVSVLYNITANVTYSCVIKNDIANAKGDIRVTGMYQPHNAQLVVFNGGSGSKCHPCDFSKADYLNP